MTLNETAQDWQDDLDTWGDLSADVVLLGSNGDDPATNFHLSPEQVRVMFAALRDHAQRSGSPEDDGTVHAAVIAALRERGGVQRSDGETDYPAERGADWIEDNPDDFWEEFAGPMLDDIERKFS